jgi:hypothetical protein
MGGMVGAQDEIGADTTFVYALFPEGSRRVSAEIV